MTVKKWKFPPIQNEETCPAIHEGCPEGTCPKCGRVGYFGEVSPPTVCEDYLEIPVRCDTCGWQGVEVHSLAFLHYEAPEA